jgi:hypothetical protein
MSSYLFRVTEYFTVETYRHNHVIMMAVTECAIDSDLVRIEDDWGRFYR